MRGEKHITLVVCAILVGIFIGLPILAINHGESLLSWSHSLHKASILLNSAAMFILGLVFQVILFILIILLMLWVFQGTSERKNEEPVDASTINSETKINNQKEIFKLEPNLYGIGINLRELWRWIKNRVR